MPTKQLTLSQPDSYTMCQVEDQSLGRQENLASCCRIRPDTRPDSSLDLSFPIYLMRRWHSLSASSNIFLHWLTVSGSYDFSRYDRVSLPLQAHDSQSPPLTRGGLGAAFGGAISRPVMEGRHSPGARALPSFLPPSFPLLPPSKAGYSALRWAQDWPWD